MITIISTLNIGFSVIAALILFVCYAVFLKSDNKTFFAVFTSGLLLAGLSALQFEHLDFLLNGAEPLNTLYYRSLLFVIPPAFYFFSRFVLFTDYELKISSIAHLLPILVVFFIVRDIAVPVAFVIGTGYCLWLCRVIYSLRRHRKRFEVEFFFFAFFSLLAAGVLIFGFSASFFDDAYFYHFYTNGIGAAFYLVTAALIIYPDLLNELTEAAKFSYTTSTLSNIDIEESIKRLEKLMKIEALYKNENLSLTMLAESIELTSHQLSELINTHYGVSFSKFIRELRVEQAKNLLTNEPNSSVLSISMETGFKSQSNFYLAFKEITGRSPGSYRKSKEQV